MHGHGHGIDTCYYLASVSVTVGFVLPNSSERDLVRHSSNDSDPYKESRYGCGLLQPKNVRCNIARSKLIDQAHLLIKRINLRIKQEIDCMQWIYFIRSCISSGSRNG